jgi:hypothetical protein
MHQVLRLCHHHYYPVLPRDWGAGILHLLCETISDDLTHAGHDPSQVLHVSYAVNRTLWHLHTCHPNAKRLVLLSNILNVMPRITRSQKIEKCSDFLVAKMRNTARGSDPAFEATYTHARVSP